MCIGFCFSTFCMALIFNWICFYLQLYTLSLSAFFFSVLIIHFILPLISLLTLQLTNKPRSSTARVLHIQFLPHFFSFFHVFLSSTPEESLTHQLVATSASWHSGFSFLFILLFHFLFVLFLAELFSNPFSLLVCFIVT